MMKNKTIDLLCNYLDYLQRIRMSNNIYPYGNWAYQNHNRFQNPNAFTQRVLYFIRNRNGWQIYNNVTMFSFQYMAYIDQFQSRRVILTYQQRKNSFKLNFMIKVNLANISGGQSTVKKVVEKINTQTVNEITSYCFDETNCLSARLIVQKQSFQQLQNIDQKQYIDNLLESTAKHFTKSITKILLLPNQDTEIGDKMKEAIEMLNLSKIVFDSDIKKRNNMSQKLSKQYKIINFYAPNPQVNEANQKICGEEELGRLNIFLRKLKNQKSKNMIPSMLKPLVYKIKMINRDVDKSWKPPTSGYGDLQRLKAEYIILGSFNNVTSQFIAKSDSDSQKVDNSLLVKKKFKVKEDCNICKKQIQPDCECFVGLKSYQTEVQIISYIRNMITDFVASYFLQDCPNQPNKVQNLYSKYYPKCLANEKIKSKQLMKLILNILQGLKTLNNSYIVHRDLKPSNILIDSKKMPKIIDFGSAYPTNGGIPSQKINQQLLTTRKYNLFYEEALFADKQKVSVKQFEQHELYDLHAFGVILKQLYSDPDITSELGNLMLINLNWLSAKCSVHNPNLRLTHEQVIYFCGILNKIWNIRCNNFSK